MHLNLLLANITRIPADIIVNSANKHLFKGSGVCGAIHAAAGKELEEECIRIKDKYCPKGLPIGDLIVTSAYNLPAKFIFHTVGPRKDDINLLKNCYLNCLKKAEELDQKSISFPAISTNLYRVDIHFSAKTVKDVIDSYIGDLTINLVFSKEDDLKVYREILGDLI